MATDHHRPFGETGHASAMYAWIWHRLPGARWVKALWALTGFGLTVFLLFQYVFPWLEPHLPFSGNGSLGR